MFDHILIVIHLDTPGKDYQQQRLYLFIFSQVNEKRAALTAVSQNPL
jgi:hypothetical protein